jgi:Protein of unknown function (DUF2971).
MEYLYHYTSLDTLALILHNRTICFNNLSYVDDIEEAETRDMGEFGKFVYVSCWTDDEEESIPLWNMYTPNMHGVRIRMPKFPFKKRKYQKGQFYLGEDIETYINMKKIFDENKAGIVPTAPHLVKVEYTEDNNKLFPKIKTESFDGALQEFLELKDMEEIRNKNIEVNYSFKDIGRFKRKNWKFQREWRYIITLCPMGIQDANPPSWEKQQEIIRRIEDRNLKPLYERLFLDISDDALSDIEILLGPKMSEAEKYIAQALLAQYCPKAACRESALRIR